VHTLAEDTNETTHGAMTRREVREAYQARNGATAGTRAAAPAPASAAPAKPKRRLKGFANVFVLLAAAGIVGTIAIPAYAFSPTSQSHADGSSIAIDSMKRANAQHSAAIPAALAPAATRDSFQATTAQEVASTKLAAQRTAAAKAAVAQAASYRAAYTGPTAAQYLAQTPAGTSYSLAAVLATAQKYIGTPYVYGGSTPAGFDCSGFVMFVYAQFGVSLPHSARAQGHIGQTVSQANAQPGDLIAFNDGSHDGFYAGTTADGTVLILDAPKPGGSVGIRPVWSNSYHFQHLGG
jgi:cell wall-associated NlpC family hydrolase